MKTLKTILVSILTASAALFFAACGKEESVPAGATLVKIGVVGEANQMWQPVIEAAAKENIIIRLVKFSDYSIPNRALNDGDVDLNAFQHHSFFEKDKKNRGFDLVAIGDTFISTMNIYSNKIKSIAELKDGDKIAIPNDATNGGRALKVLQSAGIIDIRPEAGDTPEMRDITVYLKKVKLIETDAANIPGILPDVAAGIINCNYALDFGFNPDEDAIFKEQASAHSTNSFFNLIAVRSRDKNNPTFARIVELYQTIPGVPASYKHDFKGAYVPAWTATPAKSPSQNQQK